MAFALFFSCERSSAQVTSRPVGLCRICTAESVVLTPCPPGPLARVTVISRSCGSICTSTSSASGSTATVTVDVWMRPLASVTGTRWTRCTPLSNLSCLYTSVPEMRQMTSLNPPRSPGLLLIGCTFQPCSSAYFE